MPQIYLFSDVSLPYMPSHSVKTIVISSQVLLANCFLSPLRRQVQLNQFLLIQMTCSFLSVIVIRANANLNVNQQMPCWLVLTICFSKLETSWCGLEPCYSHQATSSEKEADQELGHTTAICLWSPVWVYLDFSPVLKYMNFQPIFFIY